MHNVPYATYAAEMIGFDVSTVARTLYTKPMTNGSEHRIVYYLKLTKITFSPAKIDLPSSFKE